MAEGPKQRNIVCRRSDRLVVGLHPKGGVGNQHSVEIISNEEYEKLLRTDPAYVTTDGKIVTSSPV
jgi:hypothetical protein